MSLFKLIKYLRKSKNIKGLRKYWESKLLLLELKILLAVLKSRQFCLALILCCAILPNTFASEVPVLGSYFLYRDKVILWL